MYRYLLIIVLIVLAVGFYNFGFDQYLSLAFFNSQRDNLEQIVINQPLLSMAVFVVGYIAVTALSLPGAALLTLIAGALFGFWQGLD